MFSRPLLIIAIAYAAGIAISSFVTPPWWVPALSALFLLVSAGVAFIIFKLNSFPILVAVFAMLGWAAAVPYGGIQEKMAGYLNKNVTLSGYICKDPDIRADKTVYTLEVTKVYSEQQQSGAAGKVLLYVPGTGAGLAYGDVITVRGRPYLPESAGNPGEFDYSEYLGDRNIWALLSVKDKAGIVKSGRGGHFLPGAALAIKQRLEEINRDTMDPGHAALINGMIFGGRGGIDPDTAEVFNESGVVHILSVSGLHVGLVVGAVLALVGLAGLQRASFPIITGVLLIYVFITGMGPAVIRAAIMAWMQLLGHHMGRERDWPTALAASALVILLFSPGALFEAGFQLSFAATWGILHMGPVLGGCLERAGLKKTWVRGTLSVSLGAMLGTMPLVAYHYNLLSLISIPANLLAVPLVGLIIPLGLLAGLTGLLFIKVALVINYATAALMDLMIFIVSLLHRVPGGVLYIPSPHWAAMAAWYLSLLALPKLRDSRRYQKTVGIALVGLLAVFPALAFIPAGLSAQGKLQVHMIDVGQGDSLLVRFPGGRNMLVDAGGWKGEYEKGRGAGELVASYLKRLGIKKIDVLVLTHPHEDHAAGALYLPGRFDIGMVLAPPLNYSQQSMEKPDPAYYRLLDLMHRKDIPVREVMCGDALSIDPRVSVDVLGPAASPLLGTRSDFNNNGVVLSVRYGNNSFLFTGDIELEGQATLLESGYLLKHDVLKVPHHGSRYIGRDFINRVNPGLAIISVGQNSFGQPHPDTLMLLEDGGRTVFRTDRNGLTVLVSDGNTIKPKAYKE